MNRHLTSAEIELSVAEYFGTRTHVIVPNLSWGMVMHECDLAILSSSDYLYEVEIKISRGDLIRDKEKHKWRVYNFRGFRKLWFAMPATMEHLIEHVPEFAGVLLVSPGNIRLLVKEVRKPRINQDAKKLTEREKFQLARLGAMRIWKLKRKLLFERSNDAKSIPSS